MADLNSLAEVVAEVETLAQEKISFEQRIADRRRELTNPFLIALAASNQVTLITIRGWTPAFNDGEPCVHVQDVLVNVRQHLEDECNPSDLDWLNQLINDYD